MLEGVVASLLSRYLGDFVTGIASDHLHVGILGGDITLENLELKKEALADLELPVVVKSGFLGKLTLSIPWRQLGSKPAVVRIEKVFLLATPFKPEEFDHGLEEERRRVKKLKQVALADLFRKKGVVDQPSSTDEAADDTFTKRMLSKIVDNVQIYINDVHIRYEDDRTNPEEPFAVGLTLSRLWAQTTDENWKPTFYGDSTKLMRICKLVEMDSLSLYWNSRSSFFHYTSASELQSLMQAGIWSSINQPRHHFVLHPIHANLRVIHTKTDSTTLNDPKFRIILQLEQIDFELEENQWGDLMNTMESFARYHRSAALRQFKPIVSPKINPNLWWKFGIQAVLHRIRKNKVAFTLPHLRAVRQHRHDYVSLYRKKLASTDRNKPFDEEKKLEDLDFSLPTEQIMLFRSLAEALYSKDKQRASEKKVDGTAAAPASTGSWLWSWVSSSNSASSSTAVDAADETQLTTGLWKDLYAAVGDQGEDDADNREVPKMFERIRADFRMQRGTIRLRPSIFEAEKQAQASSVLVDAVFEHFNTDFVLRPSSFSFHGRLRNVELVDYYTRDTRFPSVIAPTRSPESNLIRGSSELSMGSRVSELMKASNFSANEDSFFSIALDHHPLDNENIDVRAHVTMLPLHVVCNYPLIIRIVEFFARHDTQAFSEIRMTAGQKFESIRKQTLNQVTWALESRQIIEIQLNVHAPKILVPSHCLASEPFELMMLDLGRLEFHSQLTGREKERNRDISNMKPDEIAQLSFQDESFWLQYCYDNYVINLTSVRAALYAEVGSEWKVLALESNDERAMDVVERFDVRFQVSVCMVEFDQLAKVKVAGSLPELRFDVSDVRCRSFFRILNAILKVQQEQAVKMANSIVEMASQAARGDDPKGSSSATAGTALTASTGGHTTQTPVSTPLRSSKAGAMSASRAARRRKSVLVSSSKTSTPAASGGHPSHVSLSLDESLAHELSRNAAESEENAIATAAATSNRVLVDLYFDVPDMTLRLSKGSQPLFVASVRGINLNVAQRVFDGNVVLSVQNVGVDDYMQPWGDKFRPLVSSASTGLLQLSYSGFDRRSPEYDGDDHVLDVRYGGASVMVTRESLVQLGDFVQENVIDQIFSKQADSIRSSTADLQSTEVASSAGDQKALMPVSPEAKSELKGEGRVEEDAARTSMRIKIHIGNMQLDLNRGGAILASAGLRQTTIEVNTKSDGTLTVQGKLGDVFLTDRQNVNAIYKEVLQIVGKKTVQFNLLNVGSRESSAFRGFDLDIGVSVGAMQIVLLPAFAYDLAKYFLEMMDMITQLREIRRLATLAAVRAAEAAETAMKEATDRKKYRIALTLSNPHMVLPHHRRPRELLVANLGMIDVVYAPASSDEVFGVSDDLFCMIKSMHIAYMSVADHVDPSLAAKLSVEVTSSGPAARATSADLRSSILEPVSADINAMDGGILWTKLLTDTDLQVRVLQPENSAQPGTVVLVAIPKIELVVVEKATRDMFLLLAACLQTLHSEQGLLTLLFAPSSTSASSPQTSQLIMDVPANLRQATLDWVQDERSDATISSSAPLRIVSLKLEVVLGKVSLDLRSGSGLIPVSLSPEVNSPSVSAGIVQTRHDGVLGGSLHAVTFDLISETGKGMSMSGSIGSIVLTDLEGEGNNRFRMLLQGPLAASALHALNVANAQFSVAPLSPSRSSRDSFWNMDSVRNMPKEVRYTIVRGVTGRVQIETTIVRPTCFVVLSPIFRAKSIAYPLLNLFLDDVVPLLSLPDSEVNSASPMDMAPPPEAVTPIDVKVSIQHPRLIVPYDPSNIESPAFVIRSGVIVNIMREPVRMGLRVFLQRAEASKVRLSESCAMGNPNGLREYGLIEPFSMAALYVLEDGSDGLKHCDVQLEVERVYLVLSLTDQKLLYGIYERAMRIVEQYADVEATAGGSLKPGHVSSSKSSSVLPSATSSSSSLHASESSDTGVKSPRSSVHGGLRPLSMSLHSSDSSVAEASEFMNSSKSLRVSDGEEAEPSSGSIGTPRDDVDESNGDLLTAENEPHPDAHPDAVNESTPDLAVSTNQIEKEDLSSSTEKAPAAKRVIELLLIRTDGFNFTFVNDYQGQNTPLLELVLSGSKLDVVDWSRDLNAFIVAEVEMFYYNVKVEVWEPLLEFWRCQIKFAKQVGIRGMQTTRLMVKADELAFINISHSMVEALVRVADLLQKPYEELIADVTDFSPYIVSNDTGVPVRCLVEAPGLNVVEKLVQHLDEKPLLESTAERMFVGTVDAGAVGQIESSTVSMRSGADVLSGSVGAESPIASFDGEDLGETRIRIPRAIPRSTGAVNGTGSNQAKRSIKMSISLLDSKYEFLGDVTVIGRKIYSVPLLNSSADVNPQSMKSEAKLLSPSFVNLMVDVSYQGGCKRIAIRSPLRIYNKTDWPLEICAELDGGSGRFLPRVMPNEHIAFPCVWAKSARVRFRPADFDSELSDKAVDLALLHKKAVLNQKNDSSQVNNGETMWTTCKMNDGADPAYRYVIDIDRASNLITGEHIIVVRPPLVITNALCVDLKLRILVGNGIMVPVTIQSGKSEQQTICDPRTSQLRIQPLGFMESSTISLQDIPAFIDVVEPRDAKSSLRLQVTSVRSASGTLHITLWTTYWIVNRTGLKVIYRAQHSRRPVPCQLNPWALRRAKQSRSVVEQTDANPQDSTLEEKESLAVWDLEGIEPREWYFQEYAIPPSPLMYSAAEGDQAVEIKVANSQWSRGIVLQGQGFVDQIDIPDKVVQGRPTRAYVIACSIDIPPEEVFWRTKVVTFRPAQVLVNRLPNILWYNQIGTREVFSLLPGEALPLHWNDVSAQKMLRIRAMEVGTEPPGGAVVQENRANNMWSGPFTLDIGKIPLRMILPLSGPYFARVETDESESVLYSIIRPEPVLHPSYRIDNLTDLVLNIQQKGCKTVEIIGRRTTTSYAWEDATKKEKMLVVWLPSVRGMQRRELLLDQFQAHQSIQLVGKTIRREIAVEVAADGPTKVLVISDDIVLRDILAKSSHPSAAFHLRRPIAINHNSSTATISVASGGAAVAASSSVVASSGASTAPQTTSYFSSITNPGSTLHKASKLFASSLLIASMAVSKSSAEANVQAMKTVTGGETKHPLLITDGPSDTDLSVTSSNNKGPAEQEVIVSAETTLSSHDQHKVSFVIEIHVALSGVGVSLVSDKPEEVVFVTLQSFLSDTLWTDDELQFEASLGRMQIDNQIRSTRLPVCMWPLVQVKDARFMKISFIKDLSIKDADYFQYIGFMIQEMDLRVDEEVIVKVMEFYSVLMSSTWLQSRTVQSKRDGGLFDPPPDAVTSAMLGVRELHINPIAASLTYMSVPGLDTSNTVLKWLSLSGGAWTNVDAAPIQLNSLYVENVFKERSEVISHIQKHYMNQLMKQVTSILMSVDFLGSPVSLVNSIGTGVSDFFYEPANAIVHSPSEFATGVRKGTTSLFKNSVIGMFNTTSKISGSLGRGAASLSYDDNFVKRRQMAAREKPKDVVQGVALGVRDFTRGMTQGVAGVVYQPVKGAIDEGAGGFVKGLFGGVVGAIAKPAAGTLDLISQTAEGVRNAASYYDELGRKRVRFPRHFPADGSVVPFNQHLAYGAYCHYVAMLDFKAGTYRWHVARFVPKYQFCGSNPTMVQFSGGKVHSDVIMVTTKYLIYFTVDRYDLERVSHVWQVPVNYIKSLEFNSRGLVIGSSEGTTSGILEGIGTLGQGYQQRVVPTFSHDEARYLQQVVGDALKPDDANR